MTSYFTSVVTDGLRPCQHRPSPIVIPRAVPMLVLKVLRPHAATVHAATGATHAPAGRGRARTDADGPGRTNRRAGACLLLARRLLTVSRDTQSRVARLQRRWDGQTLASSRSQDALRVASSSCPLRKRTPPSKHSKTSWCVSQVCIMLSSGTRGREEGKGWRMSEADEKLTLHIVEVPRVIVV